MNLAAFAIAAGAGAVVAYSGARRAMANPNPLLVRTNVAGARVPAVLGLWVTAGGLFSIGVLAALAEVLQWEVPVGRVAVAAALVVGVMAAAGAWDDSRGDEQPRGFSGHLSAAGSGRLTGGLVKIAAGGGAGLGAGLVLQDDVLMIGLTAAAVALGANLVNLLDRAPGRAGKVALLWGLVIIALGSEPWALAAAGTLGGLAAVLPADLGARGMLGDAGANPLGALLGLGLAASLGSAALAASVVVLLALNLASEVWSFSKVIERTAPLRSFDRWGRK